MESKVMTANKKTSTIARTSLTLLFLLASIIFISDLVGAEKPFFKVEKGSAYVGGVYKDTNKSGGPCPIGAAPIAELKGRDDTSLPDSSSSTHGAFASGVIDGFDTSIQFFGELASSDELSFANLPIDGVFNNNSGYSTCLRDYFESIDTYDVVLASSFTDSFIDSSDPAQPVHYCDNSCAAGRTIGSMNMSATGDNKRVILIVDGSVTIDGNIVNDVAGSPFNANINDNNSDNDIPFFALIVNGDIDITSNVTRLEGLFYANGTIDTCSDVSAAVLSSNTCNDPLTFAGAVAARDLDLKRTYVDPAGYQGGDAAEKFELSEEFRAVIDPVSSGFSGDFEVERVTELPPVF